MFSTMMALNSSLLHNESFVNFNLVTSTFVPSSGSFGTNGLRGCDGFSSSTSLIGRPAAALKLAAPPDGVSSGASYSSAPDGGAGAKALDGDVGGAGAGAGAGGA